MRPGSWMVVLCWVFEHRWFDTVLAEACYEPYPFDDPYSFERGLFSERLCTRCGQQEAKYIETLGSWSYEDAICWQVSSEEDDANREAVQAPTTYHHLESL